MDETGDEFGDLYVDLDYEVSAGVDTAPDARQLRIADSGERQCSVPGSERPAADGIRSEGDESSDSEDDLQIVLNEKDCKKFSLPSRSSALPPPGGECGNGIDVIAEYGAQGNLRTSYKGVGSFSPSTSGRHDRDLTGMNPYFTLPTSFGSALPLAYHKRCRFTLPCNMTIFDVDIEALEQKPWRNHGIDAKEFFNYDLNEESWKQYCDLVKKFRRKILPSARISHDNLRRPNQVMDSIFSCGALSEEIVSTKTGEAFNMTAEKPMGRAIQVEGGTSERMPSSVRRPNRDFDPDVVIQVKLEEKLNPSCTLLREECELRDKSFLKCAKENIERPTVCISSAEDDEPEKCTGDSEHHQKLTGEVSTKAFLDILCQVESDKTDNDGSLKMDDLLLATASPSNGNILHMLFPAPLDYCSDSSVYEASSPSLGNDDARISPLHLSSGFQDPVLSDSSLALGSRNNSSSECDTGLFSDYSHISDEQKSCKGSIQEVSEGDNHIKNYRHHSTRSHKKGFENADLVAVEKGKEKIRHCHDSYYQKDSYFKVAEKLPPNPRNHMFVRKNVNSYYDFHNAQQNNDSGESRKNGKNHAYSFQKRVSSKATVLTAQDWIDSTSLRTSIHKSDDLHMMQERKIQHSNDTGLEADCYSAMKYEHRKDPVREFFIRDSSYSCSRQDLYYRNTAPNNNEFKRSTYTPPCFELRNPTHCDEDDDQYLRSDGHGSSVFQTLGRHHTFKGCQHSRLALKNFSCNSNKLSKLDNSRFHIAEDKKFKRISARDSHGKKWMPFSITSRGKDLSFDSDELFLEKGTSPSKRYANDNDILFCPNKVEPKHSRHRNSYSFKQSLIFADKIDRHCDMSKSERLLDGCVMDRIRNKIGEEEIRNNEFIEQRDALQFKRAVRRDSTGWAAKLKRSHNVFTNKCNKLEIAGKEERSMTDLNHTGMLHYQKEFMSRSLFEQVNVELVDLNAGRKIAKCTAKNRSSKRHAKRVVTQDPDGSEIEEGQLIEEPENKDGNHSTRSTYFKEKVALSSAEMNLPIYRNNKHLISKAEDCSNRLAESCENARILEALAKMERRRERFREPVYTTEVKKCPYVQADLMNESDDVMKQRPFRKRRWVVS